MLEIKYTNSLDEVKKGFIGIYHRYTMRRTILFSIVYVIAMILGVDFIIRNPSSFTGYAVVSVGAPMLFMQWYRPYMIRNKLVRTLASFNEEKYTARFYDDRIEIETEVLSCEAETEVVAISNFGVETVDNPEIISDEEKINDTAKPEKTILKLTTEELLSDETDEMFRLYVNRSLVYIFPKRCLDETQTNSLREYFGSKAI